MGKKETQSAKDPFLTQLSFPTPLELISSKGKKLFWVFANLTRNLLHVSDMGLRDLSLFLGSTLSNGFKIDMAEKVLKERRNAY